MGRRLQPKLCTYGEGLSLLTKCADHRFQCSQPRLILPPRETERVVFGRANSKTADVSLGLPDDADDPLDFELSFSGQPEAWVIRNLRAIPLQVIYGSHLGSRRVHLPTRLSCPPGSSQSQCLVAPGIWIQVNDNIRVRLQHQYPHYTRSQYGTFEPLQSLDALQVAGDLLEDQAGDSQPSMRYVRQAMHHRSGTVRVLKGCSSACPELSLNEASLLNVISGDVSSCQRPCLVHQ